MSTVNNLATLSKKGIKGVQIDIENGYLVAQILSGVSYILGILMFKQKDDKKLKIMMIIFNVNHMIHFIFLGAIISAISSIVNILRTLGSIYFKSKLIVALFIFISVVSSLYLYETPLQLMATVGTCVGTYSIYQLTGIKLRVGLLMGSCFWLINNIYVGSIGGTLLELTLIIVNIITIIKMGIERPSIPLKEQ
ncbi:YgjV family protein [Vibrio sp. SS-MA-C1-2]|uniref:YgjV family protein n=1 Tax=Vibrio sp. SS-MA-C1-2 TaxID=2908646 RepID=UPI001F1A3CD4|nr:YgjV family protein [Vibrio sp. SS-MA-C1-2]UJF17704.1 YgjV family protein [Vibrio sp. SS-MA-C1-2]